MIVSKQALEKIRKIIENGYNNILLSVTGNSIFTEDQLDELSKEGLDVSNPESLLELIYYNNVLNQPGDITSPTSISDMRTQQKLRPKGTAHTSAEEHINESFKHTTDNMRAQVQSRIEGIIRDNNLAYRGNALQNLDRPEHIDQLIKESTLGELKQKLRAYGDGKASTDWDRIAITETANAIGLGSVDRVIMANPESDAKEVYVYRIPVVDASLCKYCRKFYLDDDGSPAVYRLSTLLDNGTNYGKKAAEWQAVVGATHVNDRESGVLQLKSGWKVAPGGKMDYIGKDDWDAYIDSKLRN